jgi:hypothetical protein
VTAAERFELEEQGAGWYIRDTLTGELVSTDPIQWRPTALDLHRKLNELAEEGAHVTG